MNLSTPIRWQHHLSRRLSAAAALFGLSVLLGLAGCASGSATTLQAPLSSGLPPGPRSGSSPGSLSPPAAVNAAYQNAVERSVADSLHLSVERVRAELRKSPGSGLENLAKPLGVAEDQLAKIILSGLDSAASAARRSGGWTASQVQAEKMYWASQSYAALITGVSSWFANG